MSIYIKPPETENKKLSPFSLAFFALILPIAVAYFMVTGNELRQFATIIALIGGALIFARPNLGLMLFVVLVYTRPEDLIEEIQGMRLSLIVSGVTLIAMLFHKLLDRQKLTRSPINLLIVGFGISSIISAAIVQLGGEAAQEMGKLVLLPILLINIIKDLKSYRQFVTVLLTLTTYLAGYSLYLYSTGGALAQEDTLRSKGTGIFGDPNDLAATMVFGLSLALFRVRGAVGWRKWFYILLTGFLAYTTVMTQSRGGFLALGATFVGFVLFSNFNKRIKVSAFVLMGILYVLASGRMANFDSAEASANSRFWYWTTGVEAFIQAPLFGIGYQKFTDINGGMTAHNTFVLCFTELGIISYFFWIGCIYLGFYTPPSLRRVFLDEEARYDIMGARVALAGFLVAAFWISRTYVPILYVFITLPTLMMTCYANHLGIELPSKLEGKHTLRILGICIASIMFIYTMAMRLR